MDSSTEMLLHNATGFIEIEVESGNQCGGNCKYFPLQRLAVADSMLHEHGISEFSPGSFLVRNSF